MSAVKGDREAASVRKHASINYNIMVILLYDFLLGLEIISRSHLMTHNNMIRDMNESSIGIENC